MARVVTSGSSATKTPAKTSSLSSSGQKSVAKSGTSKTSGSKNTAGETKVVDKKRLSGDVKLDLDPQTVGLTLKRISPLSAAKVGFFVSIALGIVLVVAVCLFWVMLDTSGIIFQFSQSLVSSGLGTDVTSAFSVDKVAIVMSVLACINVVLSTLLAMIVAAIYNAAARLGGGLQLYFSKH